MTEFEKQWRREETLRILLMIILVSVALFVGLAVIAHSIDLLGVKCKI